MGQFASVFAWFPCSMGCPIQSSFLCRISLLASTLPFLILLVSPSEWAGHFSRMFFPAGHSFKAYHLHRLLISWLVVPLDHLLLGMVVTLDSFFPHIHRPSSGGSFLSLIIRDSCDLPPCPHLLLPCACFGSLVLPLVPLHLILLPPVFETVLR